jgi:hypothetical protein
MSRMIDNSEVCQPISKLLDYLEKNNYEIVEEKLSDYHFKEFYFKVKGYQIEIPVFERITIVSNNLFTCDCHWSIVEILTD